MYILFFHYITTDVQFLLFHNVTWLLIATLSPPQHTQTHQEVITSTKTLPRVKTYKKKPTTNYPTKAFY